MTANFQIRFEGPSALALQAAKELASVDHIRNGLPAGASIAVVNR